MDSESIEQFRLGENQARFEAEVMTKPETGYSASEWTTLDLIPAAAQSAFALGGGLVPALVSVTEKIDRPDHEAAIFLKAPCFAFCIRKALDLWQ